METSLPINNLKIMISKLKLNKIQEDLVQVIDKSEYDCSSLPAKFLYEDTISINYLQKLTSDSNKVKQVYISEHDSNEETVFKISEDGYYRINHLIIPTKEWIDKVDLENIVKFDKVYFYMEGNIYEYNFKIKKATEVNPIILLGVCDLKTTVFSSEEDFFLINNLKNCLANITNQKFARQNCKHPKDVLLNTRIEYLQMIYNILDYNISCGNLLEAENILEDFLTCYNICNEKNIKVSDCNCV